MIMRVDAIILKRLNAKPLWAKTLWRAKPRVEALVQAGLVERITPPGGRQRNMLAITAAGVDAATKYWHAS